MYKKNFCTKFHLIHKLGNILQILNKQHTFRNCHIQYNTCSYNFQNNLHFLFFEIVELKNHIILKKRIILEE